MIFDSQDYTIRVIDTPTYGTVKIADTTLSDALMNDTGEDFVSDKAREVDEGIFFYVEPEHINLPKDELVALVEDLLSAPFGE
jgi:hypothetical protein